MHNGSLIEGQGFVQATKAGDLILGCHNYVELMREIHPYDFGPRAMFRVMVEHFVNDRLTDPAPLRRFFMTMTEENAGRACRGQASATYEECGARWKRINPATYGNVERKRMIENEKDEVTDKVVDKVLARMGKKDGKQHKKTKKARGGPWCKYFNKGHCPNEQQTNGCMGPNRVAYEHSCDARLQGIVARFLE